MTEPPPIGVSMLGYAYVAGAHVDALRRIAAMPSPPALPRLVAVAGRTEAPLRAAAARYGFERATTDWREVVADERVGLLVNAAANALHAEPTIAAAEAGKHVLCEKPLGRTADEAHEIWRRTAAAGVVHMCAFNYRFVPAIRIARELLEAGELGEVAHVRGRYLQDWLANPLAPWTWRLGKEEAGSGALGDLGSHLVDLAHYLAGGVASVAAATRTFVAERPGGRVDVDDAFAATLQLEGGALGTLEASRVAAGRRDALALEVNGTLGSLAFRLERADELEVVGADGTARTLAVTGEAHPFAELRTPGRPLAWGDTFVHELHHLLRVLAGETAVAPHGATFEDGYRAAEVCDAIARSAASGRREAVCYRGL